MPNQTTCSPTRSLRARCATVWLLLAVCGAPASAQDCVHSKGYWKNHPHEVQLQTMTLGSVEHDVPALMAILNEPVRGNGLVSLCSNSSHPTPTRPCSTRTGAGPATVTSSSSTAQIP